MKAQCATPPQRHNVLDTGQDDVEVRFASKETRRKNKLESAGDEAGDFMVGGTPVAY